MLALISAGRHNPFGHPDAGTLARLAAVPARVRRTDREGALWVEYGPDGVRDVDWTRGRGGAAFARVHAPDAMSRVAPATLARAPARW
jgi:competence protein ComEC